MNRRIQSLALLKNFRIQNVFGNINMKHKSLIQNLREEHFLRIVKHSETRELERKKRAQHFQGNFESQYKSFSKGCQESCWMQNMKKACL